MPAVSKSFTHTGGWQKFSVPKNVTKVVITLTGGGSRTSTGGRVIGELRVKDTDVLHILLGRRGDQTGVQAGGGAVLGGGGPGGNGGSAARVGGDSGGGASWIRLNSQSGKLLAVAGGAGGRSGDGGTGGNGGGNTGNKGNRFDGSGNRSTGGTQTKGGTGGHVPTAFQFNGDNATDGVLDRGAKGGQVSNDKAYGGGGGGGGYRAGGGGQAGKSGSWYGGGGAGGSNYVDEMFNVTANDSGGTTNDGTLTIEWQEGGDYPPSPPTDVLVNGETPTDEMILHSYSMVLTGKPDDPTKNQDVRMVLFLSDIGPIEDFFLGHNGTGIPWYGLPYARYDGTWDEQNKRDKITVNGMTPNKLYYGRIYSQDKRGQLSNSYVGLKFWTNRQPDAPVLTMPLDNTDFENIDTIEFDWTVSDPDTEAGFPETPIAWSFRWRRSATTETSASAWTQTFGSGVPASLLIPAATFPAGSTYEWQVAVKDPLGLWSPWSTSRHFHVTAAAVAPLVNEPGNGEARIYNEAIRFTWTFRTVTAGETQTTADLRYRTYGSTDEGDWVTVAGDLIAPGDDPFFDIDPETFVPGTHYEWQMRTHTSNATTSPWSLSQHFWAAYPPGLQIVDLIPIDHTRPQGALGVGNNRVYAYLRGGQELLGEITPMAKVVWSRKRDAISECTINVNEWSADKRELYRTLKSWAAEIVVMRNGKRVWEGPITRRVSAPGSLTIEAKDPMAYVYRRWMRQGYNDSYQINNGQQVGLRTVVWRARQILLNALVYDDPNVLPYLNPLMYHDDAIQSRIVKQFSKTAWQEIDDMAANAGLDYTTVGRRIILNDTHRPIGRLPELGDGDFSQPPVVTEYGMSYCTDAAATNGNGIYGIALRHTGVDFGETGHVEMLFSEYGESDIAGAGADSLTPEEIAALEATLAAQAERNIAPRYPMPTVVRVPDNATLNPEVNLGINQLIPGAWVPVRATGGIIEASQWQKIDSVTVTQDDKGEKIALVLSPAPNGGIDPDAVAEIEEV